MYTAFYGLREKPFALSPDPRFLYLAGSHREALAHLLYGIEQGEGFISVTGEVGTGKTTLCRTLLERLDGDTEVAFLFNPSRNPHELLQSICSEFGLPAEGLARRALMNQLNAFLVEQKRAGKRVLLIVDEAQTLTETTLEQVRLLSNLETSREKLIQILLLGQPELDRKLDSRGLRQLRQRISVRWQLEPLGAPETRAYVRHRLSVAAGEPKDLFSESALREIHRRTGGIPRLVNQLCDRALLAGYAARAAQIGPRLVRTAAREIPDAQRRRHAGADGSSRGRPWLLFAASFVLVLAALATGLQVGRSGLVGALRPEHDANSSSSAAAGPAGDLAARGALPPVAAGAPSAAHATHAADAAETIGSPNASGHSGPAPGSIQRPGASGAVATPAEDPGAAPQADGSQKPELTRLIGSVPPDSLPVGVAVDAPKSRVTALAPGLLGRMLEAKGASQILAGSQRGVLERFGRLVPALASGPGDPEALKKSFEGRGLGATFFDGGSLALLRRLDHPVVLALRAGDETLAGSSSESSAAVDLPRPPSSVERPESIRWVAVIGFDEERALLAGILRDRVIAVSVDELETRWLETGIIVWEKFERIPKSLAKGDSGDSVLWLQRALVELHFRRDKPNGRFDADTAAALARFQSERGLVPDGVAGPLTQVALYGQLRRYPVPRLSAGIAAAPSVPAAPAPEAVPAAGTPDDKATSTGPSRSREVERG
jgi:general secretion pathway protein A